MSVGFVGVGFLNYWIHDQRLNNFIPHLNYSTWTLHTTFNLLFLFQLSNLFFFILLCICYVHMSLLVVILFTFDLHFFLEVVLISMKL